MSKIYDLEWSSRLLQFFGGLCICTGVLKLLALVLTIFTGQPDYNRAEFFFDAMFWLYLGCIHLTLADRTDDANS